MTLEALIKTLSLETVNLAEPEREVLGGYSGDLLSWVMGRAKSDYAWITIMTNVNVLAVASLADVSCIIITENAEISDELISIAKSKQINLLRSPKNSFEVSVELGKILGL